MEQRSGIGRTQRHQERQRDMEYFGGTSRQDGSEVVGQADGRVGLAELLHMLMEVRKRQEERTAEEKRQQAEDRNER